MHIKLFDSGATLTSLWKIVHTVSILWQKSMFLFNHRQNEGDILLTYLFENIFSQVKCRLDNFNLFKFSTKKTYPVTKLKRERYQIPVLAIFAKNKG